MQQEFTKYREAKRTFQKLTYHPDEGISQEAKITLKEYEKYKEKYGDFIAASFLLSTYTQIKQMSEVNPVTRGVI